MRFFSFVATLSVILLLGSIFCSVLPEAALHHTNYSRCRTPLLLQMQWQITAVSIFILIVTP